MKYSILILLPVFVALGQEPETSGTASLPGGIEIKVGISYYHPNLDSLNMAFTDLEQRLGYQPWGESSLPYAASIEARYPLFLGQSIVVEFSGGVVNRVREDDRSWTSVWRGGAGYRFQLPVVPVKVAVQATVGLVWATVSRTYNNNEAVLNAAGNSWYIAAAGTGSYRLTPWLSVEASAGYTFINKFTSSAPEAEIDLKSPVAGLGLVVDLP